jgi:hypothetical protein
LSGACARATHHPQIQDKTKRWLHTLKKRILLENDLLPGDLDVGIVSVAGHYNHRHYQERLRNLTSAGV